MRPIDADKLQEFPIRANRCDKEHANTHFINGIESVMEYAELLPTVDAAQVVRCKDCKYWHEQQGWCDQHSTFMLDGVPCRPDESTDWKMFDADDFCSCGERRASDGE